MRWRLPRWGVVGKRAGGGGLEQGAAQHSSALMCLSLPGRRTTTQLSVAAFQMRDLPAGPPSAARAAAAADAAGGSSGDANPFSAGARSKL